MRMQSTCLQQMYSVDGEARASWYLAPGSGGPKFGYTTKNNISEEKSPTGSKGWKRKQAEEIQLLVCWKFVEYCPEQNWASIPKTRLAALTALWCLNVATRADGNENWINMDIESNVLIVQRDLRSAWWWDTITHLSTIKKVHTLTHIVDICTRALPLYSNSAIVCCMCMFIWITVSKWSPPQKLHISAYIPDSHPNTKE